MTELAIPILLLALAWLIREAVDDYERRRGQRPGPALYDREAEPPSPLRAMGGWRW